MRIPRRVAHLREEIVRYAASALRAEAAILCTGAIRPEIARFVRRIVADVPVYAYSEVPAEIALRTFGIVGAAQLS